jgi:hypothetical protein
MMQSYACMRGLTAIVCSIVTTLCLADAATAGTYLMRSCNVPGAPRASVGPWRWLASPNTFANNECATGGGFGINAGSMNRTEAAGVVIESPDAGRAVAIRRVRLWMVARLSGAGSALFAASVSGAGGRATREDLFGPPGGDTLTTPYVSPLLPADTANYIVLVSCSGSTPDGCAPSNTNVLDIKGVEVTLQESVPPTATVAGGELLMSEPQSGIRTMNYTASDAESGVARVSAILGGTVVGTGDLAAECSFSDFSACPATKSGSIPVDTRKVPDGTYPLALRVTDAAGNEHTAQATSVVQVTNGAGTDSGVKGSAPPTNVRLSAWFAANRRATFTTTHGKRIAVLGRLATSAGAPMSGVQIYVTVRGPHIARELTGTTVTGEDGTFKHFIGRGAASRVVRVEYRPNGTEARSVAQELRLRIKAAATLRVRLRGILVQYSGRVSTRPVPSAGKLVAVQGRAPGGAWKTFAQRRTDRRGVFSGTYRLRVYRPGVRLQFRVRVPREAGYPYVAHTGRAITKRVR